MAKVKYYYDPETCKFEKATVDGRAVGRAAAIATGAAVLATAIVVLCMYYFTSTASTTQIKLDNNDLAQQIEQFDAEVGEVETGIAELHAKDEEVFRAVLKAEPVTDPADAEGAEAALKPLGEETMAETKSEMDSLHDKVRDQKANFARLIEQYGARGEQLGYLPSVRPVASDVISGFGYRIHPILQVQKLHTGIDFGAPVGTPVLATADGVVSVVGNGGNGYGLQVDIRHGYGYETKFAHLSKVVVTAGKRVKRGDIIAYSGNSGLTKGPHLHYEVKKDGVQIDPVNYFYSDLSPEQYVLLKRQANLYNESMD